MGVCNRKLQPKLSMLCNQSSHRELEGLMGLLVAWTRGRRVCPPLDRYLQGVAYIETISFVRCWL